MTSTAFLLLALTLAVAVADWVAVHAGNKAVEYVAKPLTMVLLIGVALELDVSSDAARGAFVVALVLSLVGDVFLMLPGEGWFVFGLGAFLAGHIAYVVGLWIAGVTLAAFAVGLVIVGLAVLVLGVRIVRAVREGDDPVLALPVAVYIGVISLMVASAIGTESALAIAGAGLFYVSDALIAWNRFIQEHSWGRVAIMVTYHLGQIGLVLSLI
ncbi:MAG: lysoplasmalogenase [Acidimicrobiales bacterium]